LKAILEKGSYKLAGKTYVFTVGQRQDIKNKLQTLKNEIVVEIEKLKVE